MLGKVTQIDRFAAAALISFGLALWSRTPTVVASVAAAILCFLLVGVIWATVILSLGRKRSVVAALVAVTSCALGWAIVGGLLLNFLPTGLNRTNWLVYSLSLCVVGYVIGRLIGSRELFAWRDVKFARPAWASVLKLTAATALLVATVLVALHSRTAKDRDFTELWLVPNNPAGVQVRALEANSPVRAIDATLGVKNHEGSAKRYTLVFDSGTSVTTTKFTLAPQEELTKSVPIDGAEASATLYVGDQALGDPYRKVWIARR